MKPHNTIPDDQYMLIPTLINLIDKKHPLIKLASSFPWRKLEDDFATLYSDRGRKANPVRLMVGLHLLKYMYDVSDERLIELWKENPYWQAFCGMTRFQTSVPCHSTDLVYFRKRIGEKGVNIILKYSVEIHGKSALEDTVVLDTTVQIKNIAFPTDTKLDIKIIFKCLKIAKKEGIKLRRSYRTELKQLLRDFRFDKSKDGCERAERAKIRIKEIARLLINEIMKKMRHKGNDSYEHDFKLFIKVVNQQKNDSNKIYSLHEPAVQCIAKGKSHVKYEFGSTAAIAITSKSCVIIGAMNFCNNPHDSKTVEPMIEQIKNNTDKYPKRIIADRGFRGYATREDIEMILPKKLKNEASTYLRNKFSELMRRRSAIEPIIGHLKSDNKMNRNYLKGIIGDSINIVLAAAAFNCKKLMRILAERPTFFIFSIVQSKVLFIINTLIRQFVDIGHKDSKVHIC